MTAQAPSLAGCRVLVVEDEYLLASQLTRGLRTHGAEIVGPVGTLHQAGEKIRCGGFDVAALDINLRDEMVYTVADELRRRNVPFLFITGYHRAAIPATFADVLLLEKPCDLATVVRHLEALRPQAAD